MDPQKRAYEANKLQKRLRRLAGQAIDDFGMIGRGDRVMVCVSGGKDSYALLDILLSLKAHAPVDFGVACGTGFDAQVIAATDRDMKRRYGVAAYFLWFSRPATPDISYVDGGPSSEAQASFLTLAAQLEPIGFDASILSDPRFTALVDIKTAILPEPGGRPDPFSPLPGVANQ